MPIALANEQRLVQAQLISANNELNLDESILVLDETHEYSTHEEPSGPSFGESIQNATPMEEAEYMDTEVTEILDNSLNSVEEVTVYEVVTEYRQMPDVGQLLQHYPHIFVQLCDGDIIDVESGERIVNIDLTQFIANNGLEERPLLDTGSILPSQVSPRLLHIGSGYTASTQQPQSSNSPQNDIPTELQVSRLMNNPDQMSQPMSQITNSLEQSSQPLLAHEEVVATTLQLVDEVESEVMREVRDLISNIRSEGWLETETQMVYHTAESKWGGEGVPENDMVGIKQGAINKTPTNADCIKYLYGYEEINDPKILDAIYYRKCKKPTTAEELYRRRSFRIRRRRYFTRPAIYIGGFWFPEPYFPDPEDPEWSWKEGIENHPLYRGIRPQFDGTIDNPVYLTTTLEDQIFYSPEGEEWVSSKRDPPNKSTLKTKESCAVTDPLDPRNM